MHWFRFVAGCLGLAVITLASSCAPRDAPYRFRAPLVSSVRAAPLPPVPGEQADAWAATPVLQPEAGAWLRPPEYASPVAARQASADAQSDQGTMRASEIPDSLRALAGERRAQSGIEFALAVIASLGADPAAAIRSARSSERLWTLARQRGAVLDPPALPLTGDLVVLAAPTSDTAATTIGVVVATGADASIRGLGPRAVELVYLDHGQVRLAVVAPERACPRARNAGACISPAQAQAYLRLDGLSGLPGWR